MEKFNFKKSDSLFTKEEIKKYNIDKKKKITLNKKYTFELWELIVGINLIIFLTAEVLRFILILEDRI